MAGVAQGAMKTARPTPIRSEAPAESEAPAGSDAVLERELAYYENVYSTYVPALFAQRAIVLFRE